MKSLDPAIDAEALEIGRELFLRYVRDLADSEPGKARTRLVNGIQIALRQAARGELVISADDTKSCAGCGSDTRPEHKHCPHCGSKDRIA